MATVTESKRHLVITSSTYESSGDVTVGGDLFVNGAQTVVNTATLSVEDKNISLNYGGTESSSQDAGLTIVGSGATLLWDEANTRWKFSNDLNVTNNISANNLSGTNTGDQDLSGYVTLAGAQTITGNKTFSVMPTFNADTLHNGHIYGRSVDGQHSRLYRFGGLWLTWDSDSYGTNFNHSITSTDNGTYSDSITINSYDKVRINIDSNNNDSASTFTVGKHGTGTTGTLLTLEESGNLTVTGTLTASGGNSTNWNTAYGWGNHASAGYLTSVPSNASALNLNATDDRDMAPEDLSYSDDLRIFFSAKEGLEDGSSTSSNWQDVLMLNSYSDSSGGNANILAFDKSEKKIYHYQAGLSASNWGTAKELAYTDNANMLNSNVTLSSLGAQASGNYITGTGSLSAQDLTDIGNLSGTNTGDQDLSGYSTTSHNHDSRYLRKDVETQGTVLNLGGEISSGSSAKLQVYGFQRTGPIMIAQGNTSTTSWDTTNEKWLMNNSGNLYIGDGTNYSDRIFHDSYHPNADKWTTARTITLGGDLSGSVSIDGSANVTLSAQVTNNSHTHDDRYYTETESDARYLRSDYNENFTRVGYGNSGNVRYHKLATITISSSYQDYNATFEWTGRYSQGLAGIHVHSDNDTTADVMGAWYVDWNPVQKLASQGWIKYTQSGSTVEIWVKTNGWREFDYLLKDSVTEGEPSVTWYNEDTTTDQATEPSNLNAFSNNNHFDAGYGTSNLALGTTSTTALAGDTTTISSAQSTKLGHISVTQAVDLDTMESNIATNNSKTSFPGFGTTSGTALEGDTTIPSGNQIIDWTTDQGSTNIHTGNYNNTQLSDSEVIAAVVASTSISNSDKSTIRSNIGAGTSNLALGTTSTTALAGNTIIPSGNQIIDWTAENAGTIHASNYVDNTGTSGISNVVEDTSPQLGAALDMNGFAMYETNAATASIDLKDHSSYTWFRNSSNVWIFQGGTAGDDWTQTFALHLPTTDSSFNNKLMELGQRNNNGSSGGKYKGVRIVKSTGSSTLDDGYLQAGTVYVTSQIELGDLGDTTLTRHSSGNVSIEGNKIYHAGNLADNRIIDWTVDQGGTNIHNGNISASHITGQFTAGSGINFASSLPVQINADINYLSYSGSNNFIDNASDQTGSEVPTGGTIIYKDTSNSEIITKALVSDLPFASESHSHSNYITSNANDNVTGHTEWQDNYHVRLGNSADMKLYHTNGHNYIDCVTGNLYIRTNASTDVGGDVHIRPKASENGIIIEDDAGISLYYDNGLKAQTTISGMSVTGSLLVSSSVGNLDTTNDIGQQLEKGDASAATLRCDADRWRVYMGGTGASGENLTVLQAGNVGIKDSTPSYRLDVNGTIRATGDVIAYSDERVKENIKTIDNSLEKVNKLRGVEFNKIGEDKKSIGVIAQEIEKVLPEVVRTDDEGMKSVAYGNVVGVLIEAIKELNKEVEELKSKLNNGN